VWERSQPVALGEEDYARELRRGSPAQRLSALQRSLERATVRLQGSDRSRSRAIRREETLAERPRASTGFEQGASAEWAAGGATALAQHAQHVRSEFEANNLRGGDPGASSSVDVVLARSGRELRRDIERQERSALGQGLVPADPAAAAAPQPSGPRSGRRLGSPGVGRPGEAAAAFAGLAGHRRRIRAVGDDAVPAADAAVVYGRCHDSVAAGGAIGDAHFASSGWQHAAAAALERRAAARAGAVARAARCSPCRRLEGVSGP